MMMIRGKNGLYASNRTEKDGTGRCYSPSAGFTLPNGAKRAPDASWISNTRWNRLKPEDREKMARICPDFVVEVRSETNSIPVLKQKMAEYIENGARLGWLLDPIDKRVAKPARGMARKSERTPWRGCPAWLPIPLPGGCFRVMAAEKIIPGLHKNQRSR